MALPLEMDHYNRILRFEQSQRRRLGRPRLVQYLINRRYYYGDNLEPDDVNQPLGIRYVPRIINKHVHYLFGEWDRDILDWVVTPREGNTQDQEQTAAAISRCLYGLMRRAGADELFMRGALDGGIYGDTVFKLRHQKGIGATFETVLPEYFHAIWHPLNMNEIVEALIAYNMDRGSAREIFGTVGNPNYMIPTSLLDPGFAIVWERWTDDQFQLVVDDQVIQDRPNPYMAVPELDGSDATGFLPIVHIPNLGINGEFFGFGDAEAIFEIQDELNMRIADFGDIINYNAHPITLVKNYFGRFEDLRTGPDMVWNMGREGEASYLEWSGAMPAVMQYLELLMTVLFDTASLTPTSFGRAEQSQASGSALVMQMLPIVEQVRRKRAIWSARIKHLARRLILLESMALGQAAFQARYGFSKQALKDFEITPQWAPILPRDRADIVNENVALLVNKARSIETALKELGTDDPEAEREKIIADVREFAQIALESQQAQIEMETDANMKLARAGAAPVAAKASSAETPNRSGGKNSDAAKGGSKTDA